MIKNLSEDNIELYDYHLPDSAIAQTPLANRADSKLLHLNKETGEIRHRQFRDVLDIIQPDDLLVLNNTRVSAIRLFGHKESGAKVELLLLKQLDENTYETLARPGKRIQPGHRLIFPNDLSATVIENLEEGLKVVSFEPLEGLAAKLDEAGFAPLPPYIKTQLSDRERYQTVYASQSGSAAAPTAGLHFTPEILSELKAKGTQTVHVTLDVGLDTFRPIQSNTLSDHIMHGERCTVSQEVCDAVENCKGRVIAVGTTTARTLESFATGHRKLSKGTQTTSIFIRPGYEFQIIDGMFTNFHMPRTTMLMMISAISSRESIIKSYTEALKNEYRFLSFGDSMLIL